MSDHFKQVLGTSIDTSGEPCQLRDIFLDSKSWKLKFVRTKDAIIPAFAIGIREKKLKCFLSTPQLLSLVTWSSDVGVNRAFEETYLNKLGLKTVESEDSDLPPINYTSMIQANDSGGISPDTYQSMAALMDFEIETSTGPLGKIVDSVIDFSTQNLRYFVAEDFKQKERFVLIDPEWIEELDTKKKRVIVSLSREILLLEALLDSKREGANRYEIDV